MICPCGAVTHRDKYCSEDCTPYGYFRNGKRKKGPIEYFSRARLEIDRLTLENESLRNQLAKANGKAPRPKPLGVEPSRSDIAVHRNGRVIRIPRRPDKFAKPQEIKTLEERAAELMKELERFRLLEKYR